MKKIAEQYFDHEMAKQKLEDVIWDLVEANIPGVYDLYTDWYDNSIEIFLGENCDKMTVEQAKKLIDLGFSLIYENQGEEGRVFGLKGDKFGKSYPRTNDPENGDLKRKLRKREKELTEIKEELAKAWRK